MTKLLAHLANLQITIRRNTVFFLSSLLLLSACATASPLTGIDTTYTMAELSQKRVMFAIDCVGLDPKTFEPVGQKAIERSLAEKCKTKSEKKYPIPPSISVQEVVDYCMKKHDIPTAKANPDFKGEPGQIKDFMACMMHISEYRPITEE